MSKCFSQYCVSWWSGISRRLDCICLTTTHVLQDILADKVRVRSIYKTGNWKVYTFWWVFITGKPKDFEMHGRMSFVFCFVDRLTLLVELLSFYRQWLSTWLFVNSNLSSELKDLTQHFKCRSRNYTASTFYNQLVVLEHQQAQCWLQIWKSI